MADIMLEKDAEKKLALLLLSNNTTQDLIKDLSNDSEKFLLTYKIGKLALSNYRN